MNGRKSGIVFGTLVVDVERHHSVREESAALGAGRHVAKLRGNIDEALALDRHGGAMRWLEDHSSFEQHHLHGIRMPVQRHPVGRRELRDVTRKRERTGRPECPR